MDAANAIQAALRDGRAIAALPLALARVAAKAGDERTRVRPRRAPRALEGLEQDVRGIDGSVSRLEPVPDKLDGVRDSPRRAN